MAEACCMVGARPDAQEIDAALRAGQGLGTVAKRHGLVKGTLGRHRQKCLGITAAGASETPETPPSQSSETPPAVSRDRAEIAGATGGETARACTAPLEEAVAELERPLTKVPNPGDDPVTAPRKLITAEVERRVVRLRVRGKTWEEIGEQVGIDWGSAMDAAERVLLRTRGKADRLADHYREIELRRCDELIDAIWDRATDDSMARVEVVTDKEIREYDLQDKAIDRVVKLMERRAKLLGLDAPAAPAVQVNILQAPMVQEFSGALVALLAALCPEHGETVDAWLADVDTDRDGARSDPSGWLERRRGTITVDAEAR